MAPYARKRATPRGLTAGRARREHRAMQSRLLAVALVLSLPAIASADMIPSCPPGQHAQMNPVPPGAMHHAGGSCVADAQAEPAPPAPEAQPSEVAAHDDAAPAAQGGGCSVGGRSSGAAWIAFAGLLLAAVRRRFAARRRPPARCARP